MRSHVISGCCRTGAFAMVIALAVLVASSASAGNVPLTPISGMSPYPDGGDPNDPIAVTACNGGPQIGVVYRNSETEPYVAVNPTNPDNMIACWHQDRWSTGSAQGVGCAYTFDGGATWTHVMIPFTRCSGAQPGAEVEFERASDPWLTFGPDGACYYMALVSDDSTPRNGMAVAKSVDGGVTWSTPTMIAIHDPPRATKKFVFHDKNAMTADPYDPNFVYANWTLFGEDRTWLVFSRSTDGGTTWSKFKKVGDFEKVGKEARVAFRQGSQIVVLPDGTLLNAFYRGIIDKKTGQFVGVDQAIFRSYNQGKKWEKLDTSVAPFQPTNGVDAEAFFIQGIFLPVRDAGALPDIAINRSTGDLYMVWQDGSLREFGASSVVISRSTDGGSTWSSPVPVHDIPDPPGEPGQSFLPSVAVAEDGTVGVLFYDFRNDVFFDGPLDTDVFLALLTPDLTWLAEKRVTDQSFDMRQMVITGDRGFFPGDYVGLDAAGNDFVAAFTVANNLGLPVEFPQDNSGLMVDSNNRQDIVFARLSSTPAVASADRRESTPLLSGLIPESSGYALHNASPNPFNPSTTIGFELGEASPVRLEIFDVAGRHVRTLVAGHHLPAGEHRVSWDGRVENGQAAATGVYLYRLKASGFTETRRMVLLK